MPDRDLREGYVGALKDWKEGAERLSELLPREKLHSEVLAAIKKARKGDPWLIACSGGADSVCTVLSLYAHFVEKRADMRVLHFNHDLRGEASQRDEEFVSEMSRSLGLAFSKGRWERRDKEKVSEEAARRARFAFFDRVREESGGRLFYFGHHRDDVAETLLMRLSRGSGSAGLAAPRPVQCFRDGRLHLRPLMDLRHSEITQVLRESDIPWREDSSNGEDHFYRNRIRHAVVSAWQRVSPHDVVQGAARARRLLEEDDSALEEWLDTKIAPIESLAALDVAPLAGKPAALHRRAIHRFLIANSLGEVLSSEAVEDLLGAMMERRSFRTSAGRKRFIALENDRLFITVDSVSTVWPSLSIIPPATVFLPDSASLKASWMDVNENGRREVMGGHVDEKVNAFLNIEQENGRGLVVRCWKPGDRYEPLGAPGSQKLQDLFTDRKIPRVERKKLPIVCLPDGRIIWCPGLPPLEALKIRINTERALRLTYFPPSTG